MQASFAAESMKLCMMYFCLLYQIRNVGAWSNHLVAAKCGIFDEILLQIAISKKVLDVFE